MDKFTAGPGVALLLGADNSLLGMAKTLSDSSFSFSTTAEEIRGGAGNQLLGQYFHDGNLSITMTDALFKLEYVALNLGVDIQQGGLVLNDEELTVATAGRVTVTKTPVAFQGQMIGWYKLPTDTEWSIGTLTASGAIYTMAIPGAVVGAKYCVQYWYQDNNARHIDIPANYQPSEIHLVIINQLFKAGRGNSISNAAQIGQLITDIPRFKLSGSMDLSFASGSAATIPLTGNALAVDAESCAGDSTYGTMTEVVYGDDWTKRITMLAPVNPEVELDNGGTETISVYAIQNGMTAPKLMDNADLTFAVDSGSGATVSTAGVITATATGTAYISVSVTNNPALDSAIIKVTVA